MSKPIHQVHAAAIAAAALHRRTPFAIWPCQGTHFSIARHTGMIKFQNDVFVYFPNTDELVRDDVLKAIRDSQKQKTAKEVEPTLF